jgi:hypothetical protein
MGVDARYTKNGCKAVSWTESLGGDQYVEHTMEWDGRRYVETKQKKP